MLQILLYHSSSMEVGSSDDSDDDALLELVDYCHRKLVSVASNKVKADDFECHLKEIEDNPSKVMPNLSFLSQNSKSSKIFRN